jgi:ABC-type glycerol-3-phosphate transport system substrate-binding protein
LKVIELGPPTLKIWLIGSNIEHESEYMSQQLKNLENELPFRAELRMITWNRAFDTIVDAFKNDSAPDIFSTGTTWVHTLSYLKYLAAVPDSFQMRPFLAPWLREVIRVNGTNYAVPFLSEAYVLMAKQNTLNGVGIQADDLRDWDSFFSSCMKIIQYYKSRGFAHIPLALSLRPEIGTLHRYVVWLFKGGWTFPKLHPGMKSIFCSETSIKALSYISNILRAPEADLKALHVDTQSLMEQFQTTDNYTFFIGNGNMYITKILNRNHHGDISLYPFPSLIPNAKTFGGGSVLAVSSTCGHQELAWQVVQRLIQDDVLIGLCACNGCIPPFESRFWSMFEHDPNIRVLKEQFRNSAVYDIHPIWHVIEQISGEHVAHYFWDSIANKDWRLDEVAGQVLEDLDRKLIDILDMMWEMEDDEASRSD